MRPFDRRLLQYDRGVLAYLGLAAVVAALRALAIVAFAWFAGNGIGALLEGATFTEISDWAVKAGIMAALRALLTWMEQVIAAWFGTRSKARLRELALEAVAEQGPPGTSGEAAVTLGRGLSALEGYFGEFLPQLVRTIVVSPIVLAFLWWWDRPTAIAILVTLPLIPLFMALIGWATQAVQQRQWESSKRLSSSFLEILEGTATLKLFRRDRRAIQRIGYTSNEHRKATNQVLRVSFMSSMVLELAASLAIAIVAVSIGIRLIDGAMFAPLAFVVLILTPEAFLPIRMVGSAFHASTEGLAALADVFAVIEQPAAPASFPACAEGGGEGLLVEGVTEAGSGLPPLCFSAQRGELLALTGPSGIGKTRGMRALAGLAPADGGASLDGSPLTRQAVTVVAQSSWDAVLPGTVADNLALGAPIDSVQMRSVLDRLGLSIPLSLPLEPARGGNLGVSGGQVQRIAVARGILRAEHRKTPVVLFDEPTSALDPEAERLVAHELRRLADTGAIVIVITHRAALMAQADRVMELQAVPS